MRMALLAVLMMLAAGMGGCVLLPIPHVRMVCGPICGTVVDAQTGQPIEAAVVQADYPGRAVRTVQTDAQGEFRLPARYRFHYAYLLGVISYSLPYNHAMPHASLRVQARGYRPVPLTLPPMDLSEADPAVTKIPAEPVGPKGWHIPAIPLTTDP